MESALARNSVIRLHADDVLSAGQSMARIREACEANGISIKYLRTGGGKPPVVLLHGLTGNGACWTPVVRALEGDFDVIMPDARGHGGSSTPQHGYTYDTLASDVVGLIRGLGLSCPVVVGHSMGGMTAAVVASRSLGIVRSVVLVDPTFLSPERQREVHDSDVVEQHHRTLGLPRPELIEALRARHPHRSAEIVELLAEARLTTRMSAFDVLTPPAPEYRHVMSAIDVPSLLVIGDANPVVTLDMATELRDLNPHMRIEQVRGAGHGLPYDQPERLGDVIVSFLGERHRY
jgi:pimeloyl-ACP methyl ester carboxylesterase